MHSITFVLGGARSGKSRYAESLGERWAKDPVYVATSRIYDADHARRIEHHRATRASAFETIEEPKNIAKLGLVGRVVVVDCMTLWLTNHFLDEKDFAATLTRVREEADAFLSQKNHWILVSNEVGMSLHAETEMGRKFVDLQGFLNQHLAQKADRAVFMVAGLPMALKGPLPGAEP